MPANPPDSVAVHQPKIFLIGLMGAGKTTAGKALAEALKLPFYDLDEELELQEQLTVAEVFAAKGEAYFREAEAALLRKLTQQQKAFVLATGGGTPCFFRNINFMTGQGICIWLNPPLHKILQHLQQDNVLKRPVLQQKNGQALLQHLEQLLQERQPYYKQAQLHFTHAQLPVAELVKQVTKFLHQNQKLNRKCE